MGTEPALPCFLKDFRVFFPFLLFLKRGSQGTGRAWFNPRAAAQPGTAVLTRGQGLGGSRRGAVSPSGEEITARGHGERLGWRDSDLGSGGWNPSSARLGPPQGAVLGRGHIPIPMPSGASQDAGMSQPSPCLCQDPALLHSEPREQRSPQGAGIVLSGMAASRQGQAGAAVQAHRRAIFRHLSF